MDVPFYRHPLLKSDISDIENIIDGLFIGTGPVARGVEKQIAEYFDIPYALLTNSWTNAGLAALLAVGLEQGDEVILPAMTFIASSNIVELVGAKPVFVDVDPDTLLLNVDDACAAVTDKTKMIIPVHLYGQMCNIKGLRQTLNDMDREDILIFEDCAHSFEAKRDGYRPGTYSDLAAFSFYATKNIACGEGGAVITKHKHLYDALMKTRTHGMSAIALNRYEDGQYKHWDMDCIGCKGNMPDLLAAYLPRQIENIDAVLPKRHAVANRYRDAFDGGPLHLQKQLKNCISAEHLFVIHVPPKIRDEAIYRLNKAGIALTVNYRSVPTRTYYKEKYGYTAKDFPISENWGEGCLSLPLYPTLPKEEQDHVIKSVIELVYPLCTGEDKLAV